MNFTKILRSPPLNTAITVNCVRWGHTIRGKPVGLAKTLAQRLKEERVVDEEVERPVDIGFPNIRPSRSAVLQERLGHLKAQRHNADLEKLSRSQKLQIDLDDVKREWLTTSGPYQVMRIAKHFGVFEHLFGRAYFLPRVFLDVKFEASEDGFCHPVYNGNIIKPVNTEKPPIVDYDASFSIKDDKNSLWTLILTNADGNLFDSNKEVVHWFVGNIKRNNIDSGETIVPYFRACPPKGTGYHRHIFVLYKQECEIDFSAWKHTDTDINIEIRSSFSTLDFYRQHQDDLTPAGLAFFQADYDASVQKVFHDTLKMQEPIFEYDFPAPFISDQQWFPLKKSFNLYMDKYRDPKQINKEYLEKKLSKTDPFKGPEPELKYPNAHPIKNVPSWLLTEIQKDRLKWGRINDIE